VRAGVCSLAKHVCTPPPSASAHSVTLLLSLVVFIVVGTCASLTTTARHQRKGWGNCFASHMRVFPLAVHQAYALTEENILQFKEAWMHLDPRGTQYIPANLLLPLLRAVQYPLGILGARTCCDLIACCCHLPPSSTASPISYASRASPISYASLTSCAPHAFPTTPFDG
jgi:hypothetical protein